YMTHCFDHPYSIYREFHSFPTRRSSDLIRYLLTARKAGWYSAGYTGAPETRSSELNELWQPLIWQERRFPSESFLSAEYMCSLRSEEHTSELQSRENLVCRLLLEKKNC